MNKSIKKQFKIFVNHSDLVYLDNGATTLTPDSVVEKMNEYYNEFNANIHRGGHKLGVKATESYEGVRVKVADFVNAGSDKEIVFTSGTTHGLNILAFGLKLKIGKGDNIVLTRLEHHANLLPWQRLAKDSGAELRFIELLDFEIDMDSAKSIIDENTKILSVAHISNVTGTLLPVEKLCRMAKGVGAVSIIDGAQSVGHRKIDVQKIGCDAFVFSAHKMYGPTGVGVLWAKEKLLNNMSPYMLGGGMISTASYNSFESGDLPNKFEAGTPNIAGVVGLGAAVEFVEEVLVESEEKVLVSYAIGELLKIKNLKLIGCSDNFSSVVSFIVEGVHHYDLATLLDEQGIAVRAGHHCAEPLMDYLGIEGTIRISFGVYNTKNDVDCLVKALEKVLKIMNKE